MTGFVLTSIIAAVYWLAAAFERYKQQKSNTNLCSPFTESIYAEKTTKEE